MSLPTGARPSIAPTREEALGFDRSDPLAGFRDRFVIPTGGPIYMDGNSLGRLPRATVERLRELTLTEWGGRLVEAWEDWIDLPIQVGDRLAALVGAGPGEVLACDSTSVNLYKLAGAVLDASPNRRVLVTDAANFPTDRYVLAGLARSHGVELRSFESDPVSGPSAADVAAAIDDDVALVCLSHVAFRSAALADMIGVTEAVHARGALVLWDLSHSVGAVPVDLNGCGADLAVGCTYKYLNGGPGAPAFLFVRGDLQDSLRPPIWGWFGHADQFAFEDSFRPASGIGRFQVGSPPIAGLAAAGVGADLVAEAGIAALRTKSILATEMMLALYDSTLAPLGVGLGSPRDPRERGSHLSFLHPGGLALSRWLRREAGVVVDFRPPDTIRVAVAPLYNTFAEAWDSVDAMSGGLAEGVHLGPPPAGRVT
jgi:kynureninase